MTIWAGSPLAMSSGTRKRCSNPKPGSRIATSRIIGPTLRTLFKFAAENRSIADPMLGLTFKYRNKGEKPRRSFTDTEAASILTKARDAKPVIRWCQWVAAYTGSRVGEIAECSTRDVRSMGEMWVIDIRLENPAPDASLKTEAAHRTVALHSALLAEGFLDYVDMVRRDCGEGPLFPNLRPNRNGRRSTPASNAVSKWMRNRLSRRIGPNHSWRHLFQTVHRRLRTRQDIVDAIMGHESSAGDGSIGRHYGEYEVAVCRSEIERMPKFCD
jgi:integrase